jgi:hypothetical protein
VGEHSQDSVLLSAPISPGFLVFLKSTFFLNSIFAVSNSDPDASTTHNLCR